MQTTTYANYTYPQGLIATFQNLTFFTGSPRLYESMSENQFERLGSKAEVRTGLQTGDNKYYIRKREGARGGYRIMDEATLLTEEEVAKSFRQ